MIKELLNKVERRVNIYFMTLLLIFLALLLFSCNTKRRVHKSKEISKVEVHEEVKVKEITKSSSIQKDSSSKTETSSIEFKTDSTVNFNYNTGELVFKPKGSVKFTYDKKEDKKTELAKLDVQIKETKKKIDSLKKEVKVQKETEREYNNILGWVIACLAFIGVIFLIIKKLKR